MRQRIAVMLPAVGSANAPRLDLQPSDRAKGIAVEEEKRRDKKARQACAERAFRTSTDDSGNHL